MDWRLLLMLIFGFVLVTPAIVLWVATHVLASRIEARFPPLGEFIEVGGRLLHVLDEAGAEEAGDVAIVFLHGASSNLRDLSAPLGERLAGAARFVHVDRPGHGYSQRDHSAGSRDHLPDGQAVVLDDLMERIGVERAVLVGHSYGAAVAAAWAVTRPERVAGLVFLTPASHPWPGAGINWYYRAANLPVLGWLFTRFLAVPGGNLQYGEGVKAVFHPARVPPEYERESGTRLVLRPQVFANNARDVASLHGAVSRLSPQYGSIRVPTVIVTGDKDQIVWPSIHSKGLHEQIRGSRLVWLPGDGHMPQWTHGDRVAAEILSIVEAAKNSEQAGVAASR